MAKMISRSRSGVLKSGRARVLVAVAIAAAGLAVAVAALRPQAVTTRSSGRAARSGPATAISIDPRRAGDVFSGIGAISGGGGNSRYLIDYPKPERSQILDYLFKPGYGASFQMLKMEIGGDASSSDGSEPSIQPTRSAVDCNVGYEWWLAQQAVARNPNIKLYGLQWTAPQWTEKGSGPQATIWSQRNVKYVIHWLNCAKKENLTISYLGGWDESGYNAKWYEALRAALDAHGYRKVQIVAADGHQTDHWSIARALANSKKFRNAVSIVGEHNSCSGGQFACPATSTAESLHKPLWMAEIGGLDPNRDAGNLVRAINRMYIDGHMTALLEWPLISAMPAGLPHQNRGPITAVQPWSGSYTTAKLIWATAQTTQFVQPGWRYVRGADGMLGNSGSYVTYVSPQGADWTMVAENTGTVPHQHIVAQTVRVTLTGALAGKPIHVWETDLKSHHPARWFMRRPDITPAGATFRFTIPRNYVVTFSTTTGQSKAAGSPPAIPEPAPLTLPYVNSLNHGDGADLPPYVSPVDGSFGIVRCAGGRAGDCLQQTTPATPVLWHSAGLDYPYAIVGDPSWSNYTVSVDALIAQANGTAGVIGRFSNRASRLAAPAVGNAIGLFDGYMLDVTESGHWRLLRNGVLSRQPVVLKQGRVPALGHTWHTLSLSMRGTQIWGAIDGTKVGPATDSRTPAYTAGPAGFEAGAFTGLWPADQFQNLSVTSLP